MYLSPWNLHKEIICELEELEVEKIFSSNLDSEPFSEFFCLLPKNVPQPDGLYIDETLTMRVQQ